MELGNVIKINIGEEIVYEGSVIEINPNLDDNEIEVIIEHNNSQFIVQAPFAFEEEEEDGEEDPGFWEGEFEDPDY